MPMKAEGAKPVSVAASRCYLLPTQCQLDTALPTAVTDTLLCVLIRWKWAIRRVIRQIEVARVTERLRRREMRMSFPIDGNSNMALAKGGAQHLQIYSIYSIYMCVYVYLSVCSNCVMLCVPLYSQSTLTERLAR